MGAAARCTLGGQNFREHATTTYGAAGSTGHCLQARIACMCVPDQGRTRIVPRVALVKTGLICENNQGISLDEVRHQRSERVVIAEADFFRRNGIVLVDDRYYA